MRRFPLSLTHHLSLSLSVSLSLLPTFFLLHDCRILITLSVSSGPLSSDLLAPSPPSPLAGVFSPLSSLFCSSLLVLKIKGAFIALQCLVMVARCSCLPVWSNNNSLISFYHSLSNRPKSFPKPTEDCPSAFSAASFQRPFHQPRSVPQASECERLFQSLQLHVCSVCVCVCVCACVCVLVCVGAG